MEDCKVIRVEDFKTFNESCAEKLSFEDRMERFFSSFPTITKDWLHYKM